jgi:hypothetical protein
MSRVYVSCPISIKEEFLDLVCEFIDDELEVPAYCWDRGSSYGSYEEDTIHDCAGFVLIPPNNEFQLHISKLPSGCKKELNLAIKTGSQIFLAYKAKEGLHIYPTTIVGDILSGISGTYGRDLELFKYNSLMRDFNLSSSPNTGRACCGEPIKSYEVRLLLLLR